MDRDEARRLAEAAGLSKLTPEHLDQFARGAATQRELAARIPRDLDWTEEPVLVFRLRPGQRKRS